MVGKRFGKKRLTVVNHHRIDNPHANGFSGFNTLVSATPEMFERQVAYLKSHYNLVAGKDVSAFVKGAQDLPENACLITFDDGYLDNFQNAAPILAKYNAPAVIFLATSRMSEPHLPLWWDEVAQLVSNSDYQVAELPLLGRQSFSTPSELDGVCKTLIQAMKRHDVDARNRYIQELTEALGNPVVDRSHRYFMNWDEVRMLLPQGIEFHAHTVNHPILSQVDEGEAESELVQSRQAIENETDQRAGLFAYPNGEQGDYNTTTLQLLAKHDFDAAFTLVPGPVTQEEVIANPYEIRRIYLSNKDVWSKFRVKLEGVPRLLERC